MNWTILAQTATPPREAARIMNCDAKMAWRRLEEACAALAERRRNIQEAERVILADGLVRQEISRHAWDEVALGIRHTASPA